jgi:regulator of protease activity HflC (stomatin/prohibitin superfamily)
MALLIVWIVLGVFALLCLFNMFAIIRPTQRGLIERLGKYNRYAPGGLVVKIPFIERVIKVDITENLFNATPQEIITKDKLNATVDAQIYFKVKPDEQSVKASQYHVYDYENQIVNLAKTTLRNIIGTMMLNEANSDRNKINNDLMEVLSKETKNWGIEVVRTELKEINPPRDVQETMNNVVKAENTKQAAVDFATATETEADGRRRAKIKEAEGTKQASILEAEGKAKAFELINKSFVGNAQLLKRLDVTENSLRQNAKIVLPEGKQLVNVIGSLAGLGEEKKK